MKSSKTTAVGVIGGLALILTQVWYQLDTDPTTVFELSKVIEGLGLMGIGFFARDNDVTSEQAGAK